MDKTYFRKCDTWGPFYALRYTFSSSNRHKSPHRMDQFHSLHKSVSTPSIVVEGQKKKKKREEPTHIFLQRLIADHDWTRPVGSDSDTDDDAGKENY